MRFLPHAHRISLLSPAPVSHIFHSCRPSMPRKQKAALVPTPIKQSHEAMVVSYRPQTLHDTIHTVLPGEVLPVIPSYSEFIAVRLFVFQLTASRRDWRRSTPRQPTSAAFQLTASRRGWRENSSNQFPLLVISTHSLTKRLTVAAQPIVVSVIFQLTASRRGWPGTGTAPGNRMHFNSQPHEEADSYQNDDHLGKHISTHSLTKRLTFLLPLLDLVSCISTHSLTKRLTSTNLWGFTGGEYFNSQPHEEADNGKTVTLIINVISTHSLTKRLTA